MENQTERIQTLLSVNTDRESPLPSRRYFPCHVAAPKKPLAVAGQELVVHVAVTVRLGVISE